MRDYELALVIDPDITSENQKKLLTKIKKIVEELKGKLEKENSWGGKDFAYPIKKKTRGFYFLLALKMPESGPKQLEEKLKFEDEILRYLLVRKD